MTGPVLKLWKVSRMDMGAYMCIAKVTIVLGSSLLDLLVPRTESRLQSARG